MDGAALQEAVWDKFSASQASGTIYDAVTGRMVYGRRPDDWADKMPYIVFRFVSSVPTREFGIVTYDSVRLSFSSYDDRDQTDIHGVVKKLRSLFDDATLLYAGAELIHVGCTRILTTGPEFFADDAGGGVWRDVTDYEVQIQEA